jgi:cardiolipin synthase
VAFAVFLAAGLSDALDGFLAKRFGLASRFGAWLDPAADKLLMLASFATLTVVGKSPAWLTGLVIGRDVAIVAGILFAKVMEAPLKIAPLMVGKASTVVQVAYIALILLWCAVQAPLHWPLMVGEVAVALLTLASFVAYAAVWLKAVAPPRVP